MTHTENIFTQYLFVSNKTRVQNIFLHKYLPQNIHLPQVRIYFVSLEQMALKSAADI